MTDLLVSDLAAVVYSSGKVFDGLSTGRLDTENFLRSGDLTGITSRSDLALLKDLRDASQFIIDTRDRPIDAAYVRDVNARLTRSAALHPGRFRRDDDRIGVNTPFGRHEPRAPGDDGVQRILDRASTKPSEHEQALDLFVNLAKAQPFMDGNKRTAIVVANAVLIRLQPPQMLTVPVDEADPARRFTELLARAYLFDEHDGVKDLLRKKGLGLAGRRPPGASRLHL